MKLGSEIRPKQGEKAGRWFLTFGAISHPLKNPSTLRKMHTYSNLSELGSALLHEALAGLPGDNPSPRG